MCSHLPLIYTRLIALSFGARAVDNDSIAEAQAQAALLAAARVTAIESTREAERGEAKEEEESKNEIEDKRGPAAEEEEKGEQADAVDEKKRGRKLLARPIPEGGWFGNFFLCFLCFLFFFFCWFFGRFAFFFFFGCVLLRLLGGGCARGRGGCARGGGGCARGNDAAGSL